ncbi:MAG: hypothetical protein U0401_02965 [Anaerolineae bacterium]
MAAARATRGLVAQLLSRLRLLPHPFALASASLLLRFASATTPPTYPTTPAFGDGRLRLLSYDLHDDPDNGLSFRFTGKHSRPARRPYGSGRCCLMIGDNFSTCDIQVLIASLWYPPVAPVCG